MDFNDTPQEAEFRKEARAWLEANARVRRPDDEPDSMTADDESRVAAAQAWQRTKADAGWACITWPKEYGGRAATPIQNVIWNQEEGRFNTPPSVFVIGQGMLGPTLMVHGTEEQKSRYLEPMLRGDEIWCQLFSEPSAGSDLAGLRTTARQDGDDWVINGQKIWTSGAHYSKFGMCVTRTDPTVAKHSGLTYFIVDMEAPGIEIKPIKQINGAVGFNEVFFTDVRVPSENIVGKVNDGWRGAITTLMNERAAVGGGRQGMGISDLIRLAKNTELNGRPAIEDSQVRQRIADFYVRAEGVKFVGYRTLTALSRGQTPGPENSISKLVNAPLRQKMNAFAMELQGMAGGAPDASVNEDVGAWQDGWLGAPGGRIAGGTDEIMRNIIAERVLGLPGEVRVDKEIAFKDIPTGN